MKRTKREKQKLAHIVRQQHGYEMTPDECHDELTSAYAAIRKNMAAKGWKLSDDDDQLRAFICEALRKPAEENK